MTTEYYTHDNFSRPFKVLDNKYDKTALIYHQDLNKIKDTKTLNSLIYQDDPIYNTHYIGFFIGKSPKNTITEYSNCFGNDYDGNSILLQIAPLKYVFVGHCITEFKTNSIIIDYVSPVGNNDVPYPYAIDNEGYYYLILENVKLKMPNNVLNIYDNPYNYYYDNNKITCNFKNIKKYFIDNQPYVLTYGSNPSEEYDRISKWNDFGDGMKLILTNGTQQKLNKQQYINLINEYGNHCGFQYFDTKNIISISL
jgi:hypothetical protein